MLKRELRKLGPAQRAFVARRVRRERAYSRRPSYFPHGPPMLTFGFWTRRRGNFSRWIASRETDPTRPHQEYAGPVKVPPAVHARRGLRKFTIGVSEDDLRVIAEHGNEGAASAPEWACDAQSPRTSVAVEDGEGAPPLLADTPATLQKCWLRRAE